MKKNKKAKAVRPIKQSAQPKVQSRKHCPTRFKFARFEIGYRYAASINGEKIIGLFGRRSKVKANTVTLYVPKPEGQGMKQIHVPKAAIIQDPWAAVQNVPRTAPPKCVLFKKQSMCEKKYWNGGGQSKPKGTPVKPRVKSAQL